MRKRLLALGLSGIMAMSLAACGGGAKPAATEAPAASAGTEAPASDAAGTEAPAAPAAEEQVTIKVALWDLPNAAYMDEIREAFEASQDRIKVEWLETTADDYNTKLITMLNGGSDMDAYVIKEASTLYDLHNKGQAEDLTSYIANDPDISTDMYNGLAEQLVYDGAQAALPLRSDIYLLFYNKDMFDAANLEYPANDMTWTEFEELAGKLTTGSGAEKVYGAHFHTWQALAQNWGVQDGVHTIMDTDYSFMKDSYEMLLRMQDAGTIMDFATIKSTNLAYADAFSTGKTAMVPMGSWLMQTMITRVKNGESNVNWGVATIPHWDNVEAGYTVGSTTPIAINAASGKKEAAWEFVKFMCGKEAGEIMAKAGVIAGCATPEMIDLMNSIEGMPEGASEALATKNIALDRPLVENAAEVNTMLGEEHGLIMLGEMGLEDALKEMGERSAEIQGK